jgi:hypothetical protein
MMIRNKNLIVSSILLLWSSRANAATDCTLPPPLQLEKDLTFAAIMHPVDGTFTMTFTYTGGSAWIGIGINDNGRNKMTPSNAVIGRAFEDGSTSVLKYRMTSDAENASGVQNSASQETLTEVSFNQDGSSSTLTFTQLLDDSSWSQVNAQSTWIYAVGLANNQWTGRHKISGSFQMELEACIVVPDTSSAGANSSSQANAGFTMLDTTRPYRSSWAAHGIILGLAWGICAPLGIGVSILRNGLIKMGFQKGLWYQLHLNLNMAAMLLTVIGFFIAIAATRMEEGTGGFDGTHQKAGLAIFLLVIAQAFFGYFRPGLPSVPSTPSPTERVDPVDASNASDSNCNGICNGIEVSSPSGMTFAVSDDASSSEDILKTPPKSLQRRAWEYGHRFLGILLLGLAWYNCHSGLELMVDNWDDQKDLTGLFWGVTAGISGMVFLLAYIVRV